MLLAMQSCLKSLTVHLQLDSDEDFTLLHLIKSGFLMLVMNS